MRYLFSTIPPLACSTLFPYTTLFRSFAEHLAALAVRFEFPERLEPGTEAVLEGLGPRSEEHTSELQSHSELVCRLLRGEKKGRTAARGVTEPHERCSGRVGTCS